MALVPSTQVDFELTDLNGRLQNGKLVNYGNYIYENLNNMEVVQGLLPNQVNIRTGSGETSGYHWTNTDVITLDIIAPAVNTLYYICVSIDTENLTNPIEATYKLFDDLASDNLTELPDTGKHDHVLATVYITSSGNITNITDLRELAPSFEEIRDEIRDEFDALETEIKKGVTFRGLDAIGISDNDLVPNTPSYSFPLIFNALGDAGKVTAMVATHPNLATMLPINNPYARLDVDKFSTVYSIWRCTDGFEVWEAGFDGVTWPRWKRTSKASNYHEDVTLIGSATATPFLNQFVTLSESIDEFEHIVISYETYPRQINGGGRAVIIDVIDILDGIGKMDIYGGSSTTAWLSCRLAVTGSFQVTSYHMQSVWSSLTTLTNFHFGDLKSIGFAGGTSSDGVMQYVYGVNRIKY